jgi:alpha-L-rhamnosidase
MTYYGKISNGWKITGDQVSMQTDIPVNTTALVYFPSTQKITVNGKTVEEATELKYVSTEKGYTVFRAGSGKYSFEGLKN